MKRFLTILSFVLLLPLLPAALPGCGQEPPAGTAEDWLSDARQLEVEGSLFQEARENAPRGALEYYRLYRDAQLQAGASPESLREIVEKIAWLEALKLVLADNYLGKADYPKAILAMTEFRATYPQSRHFAMALFMRGLSKEYDLDAPDLPGAVADFRQFISENPDHPLVPEVLIRIGHCYEFNLDDLTKPDVRRSEFAQADAVYDELIAKFGPDDATVAKASDLTRRAVERALYSKAQLFEKHPDNAASAAVARANYQRAVDCYRRLTQPVFFEAVRFKRFQFVTFRLGCLLADELGQKDEGLWVLRGMAERWRQSPWYGKVMAKIEEIEGVGPPPPTDPSQQGLPR